MSSLYEVSVREVGEDWADFNVTVVHPDAGGVPDDATFAFRILFDPTKEYAYKDQPEVSGAPLTAEMDLQDYLNEQFISDNARGFIASAKITWEENHPPPYYGDEGYEEFWDSRTRSIATLRVEVTHPGWVAHLSVGMAWDTAAYGTWNASPWTGPTRRPGDRVVEIAQDPMQGMHIRARDERMKEYAKALVCEEYIVPTFGDSHYVTKDALVGDEITVEALRALLGQPVLVLGGWKGREVGLLTEVSDTGSIQVYHESKGGYGSSGMSLSDIKSIGRAWHKRRVPVEDIGL